MVDAASSQIHVAVGTIIGQKYRLEGQVARGGMGAVWAARHLRLGSQLAIKFLDPGLAASPAFVARFEREARAAATIQSRHVVQVHDFGMEGGTPYIVMELLRGEDLRARLRRVGRLSLPEAAGLLVQLGKALRRAHEAGIVHRDIKPGNLFLARSDEDETLKVLDFGIAKHPEENLGESTRTGEIIGSPHYVSPEQGRSDKDVDHRTDVWSVGVIAYRMTTGHLPFPGEGLGNVLAKILVDPPPKVGSFVATLPESLDAFFALALAKKREERFQSVRELVEAFVSIVRSAVVEESVPPPSWSTIHSLSVPPGDRPPAPTAEADPPPVAAALPAPAPPPAPASPPTEEPHSSSHLDSLTPATGPGFPPPRPVVRFRWAIVGTMGLLLAIGMWFVWSRAEPVQSPSTVATPALPETPAARPETAAPLTTPKGVTETSTAPPKQPPSPSATATSVATGRPAAPARSGVFPGPSTVLPPPRTAPVPPRPAPTWTPSGL